MDSNTETLKNNKNILIVKLPANVKNAKKSVEMLGGKDKIFSKFSKDEDLDLNLFNKKIPLEKCLCNDYLIRRKRMRNKQKPGEYKYKYEAVGKIDSIYEYFALHDFICLKENTKETDINNLEKFVLTADQIEKAEIGAEDEKELKIIRKVVENKLDEEGLRNISNAFTILQPDKFSYARNSYSHLFQQLKSEMKFNK